MYKLPQTFCNLIDRTIESYLESGDRDLDIDRVAIDATQALTPDAHREGCRQHLKQIARQKARRYRPKGVDGSPRQMTFPGMQYFAPKEPNHYMATDQNNFTREERDRLESRAVKTARKLSNKAAAVKAWNRFWSGREDADNANHPSPE